MKIAPAENAGALLSPAEKNHAAGLVPTDFAQKI